MEATIRTNLMQDKVLTEEAKPVLFSEWAKQYLEIETVKSLRSFKDRCQRVTLQLVPFFGGKIITEIRPKDIEAHRAQRVGKNGQPVSLQSVNQQSGQHFSSWRRSDTWKRIESFCTRGNL
jgi:hypothetical protein